jgi:hypothetical protein
MPGDLGADLGRTAHLKPPAGHAALGLVGAVQRYPATAKAVLDHEAGQHVTGDAADPFAHHPGDVSAFDRFQQVGQAAVAGHRHVQPCVVLVADLAALVQVEHPGLHAPVVGDEGLAGREQGGGHRGLSGDAAGRVLVVLGGDAANERDPGLYVVSEGLVGLTNEFWDRDSCEFWYQFAIFGIGSVNEFWYQSSRAPSLSPVKVCSSWGKARAPRMCQILIAWAGQSSAQRSGVWSVCSHSSMIRRRTAMPIAVWL